MTSIPCGRRQRRGARQHRVHQRPVGDVAIFVRIAQQQFPGRKFVAVLQRGIAARIWRAIARQIEIRLADPVGKAERFVSAHVRGRQVGDRREPGLEFGGRDRCAQSHQAPRLGIQRHQHVRDVTCAPVPVRRCIRTDITQPAGPLPLARHAGQEIHCEPGQHRCGQAQRAQAAGRESDMQRCLLVRGQIRHRGHRGRAQPRARRRGIDNAQQKEAGLGQRCIAGLHQALHVLGLVRGARHIRESQRRAASSVIAAGCSPARMRLLRARSSAVSPGYALYQTSVGSWWRRR